ncbi:matrixin family metalloprotease [Rhodohalobacter sp.]|uniref:matrixin family metalloprotease n=1 Tax=Rhodohalobacter sp. TaxID=1974210 RepID=UPI002ACD26B8|nr:matrixin family metalloprotease [Rhodohalobacter sp.]MDZ7758021.1 matrixin family metalloprotease [Rhodohalobacter sp.]
MAILILAVTLISEGKLLSKQSGTAEYENPILWSVGTIDTQFGISESELVSILEKTTALWSDAISKELFRKDDSRSDSSLTIHLIYSQDQQRFDSETAIADSIMTLRQIFYPKQISYNHQVRIYQNYKNRHRDLLNKYNGMIEDYHEALSRVAVAGARTAREQDRLKSIKRHVDRLESEIVTAKRELKREEEILMQLADDLNSLADRINEYIYRQNRALGIWTTFRKGVYLNVADRPKINIYQFDDLYELQLVLAHELGHALGLPHVQNRKSIMYYRFGEQDPEELTLTVEDMEALNAVCSSDKEVY